MKFCLLAIALLLTACAEAPADKPGFIHGVDIRGKQGACVRSCMNAHNNCLELKFSKQCDKEFAACSYTCE